MKGCADRRTALFLSLVGAFAVACGGSESAAGGSGGAAASAGLAGSGGASGSGGIGGLAGAGPGGSAGSTQLDAGPPDASTGGAAGGGNKAALCTDTFGDALTDSFGRLDGTVLALVAPSDTQCPLVNNDHLVIEVTMNGAVYRMVVNVDQVFFLELDAQLSGSPWSEGWHTNVDLDYPGMLKVHSAEFVPIPMSELVVKVAAEIEVGAPISVFAVSSGGSYASSAHLVHRNNSGPDGAIVVNPTGTPHYLLFRFDNQTF